MYHYWEDIDDVDDDDKDAIFDRTIMVYLLFLSSTMRNLFSIYIDFPLTSAASLF